jgi:endoglucanase
MTLRRVVLRFSSTAMTALSLLAPLGCVEKQGQGAESPPAKVARKPPPPPMGQMTVGRAQPAGNNLFWNSDFEEGTALPWSIVFNSPAAGTARVEDGWACLEISNSGSNSYDVVLRQRALDLVTGHTYTLSFKARASSAMRLRPRVGMAGPPYTEYWSAIVDVGTEPQVYSGAFKMGDRPDPNGDFSIHFGGELSPEQPVVVCLDDLRLDDPDYELPAARKRGPRERIRVNQLGYLPRHSKIAALSVATQTPLEWQLLDAGGQVVARGKSKYFGEDRAAGEVVHWIDFTSFTGPGTGYKLRAGEHESVPFAIGTDLYSKLKYDALAFFYHQRSDVEIKMPYAGAEQWTRPAGHKRDKQTRCGPKAGCKYTLDVSGGWYDAGDHGKYVVNAGITVWTLFNQYERALYLGTNVADFGDGKMNIPENKNGVPDLLDEARYEMEFLLKMQVPQGKPKAGMVHQRMHDEGWTAIPTRPDQDPKDRYLRAVATAATLNLAATAAQAARLFKKYDQKFAQRCLVAAERAWQAANKYPDVVAPGTMEGGGTYGDGTFTDEFYWAAAELFVTTGKREYREQLEKSKHHQKMPTAAGGGTASMDWAQVSALGTISLAVVPNQLGAEGVKAARQQIIAAADLYLGLIEKRGYRVPVASDSKAPWGSNSFILNSMIILGLAYDFTRQGKYLSGVIDSMDYILGRNPLSQSYVTGYGTRPLQNPHHRFWAHQADAKFPPPPPGIVGGGPNTNVEDPYAQAAGMRGCPPQKCFIDHIESWSTNEIAINWNAPFAWALAFLDEQAKKK